MEMVMANGFAELSANEMIAIDGGGEWSWSWYEFGKSTVSNAAGGAASGAVYGALGGTVALPGGGTAAGAGAGAAVGALAGGAWGAASYTVGQIYDCIFG